MLAPPRPLTKADEIEVFKLATKGLPQHCGDRLKTGMTDTELKSALENTLGIFGGSGGPKRLSITFQGAGLKIWGGWQVVNHVKEKPLFAGAQTVATAREMYSIPNPDNQQMRLL
jgi:hypothetical protein